MVIFSAPHPTLLRTTRVDVLGIFFLDGIFVVPYYRLRRNVDNLF